MRLRRFLLSKNICGKEFQDEFSVSSVMILSNIYALLFKKCTCHYFFYNLPFEVSLVLFLSELTRNNYCIDVGRWTRINIFELLIYEK